MINKLPFKEPTETDWNKLSASLQAAPAQLRGNVPDQPDHKVKHRWGRKGTHSHETCEWCGGERVYHEAGKATPYCMDAPKDKVDAWRADEARRIAEDEEGKRAKRQSDMRYRAPWSY